METARIPLGVTVVAGHLNRRAEVSTPIAWQP